jgi:hypothetical protein
MENNNTQTIPDRYITPYLFLLIGTNPLPNYVAAKLLWDKTATKKKLILIHTDDTLVYAESIKSLLGNALQKDIECVGVDESKPSEIFKKVHSKMEDLVNNSTEESKIGINYTGGTKAMAVHAYKAVSELAKDSVRSYLDARTLSLIFEKQNTPDDTVAVRDALTVTLDEMMALHNFEYLSGKKPRNKPDDKDLAKAIGEQNLLPLVHAWSQDLYRVTKAGLGKKPGKTTLNNTLGALPLPCIADLSSIYGSCKTIGDLAKFKGWSADETCFYFDGAWLEDYVLYSLGQIKASCSISEVGMDVKPIPSKKESSKKEQSESDLKDFQIDDYAIRGYQLFAISCGTGSEVGNLKLKLFEILVRAREIGGDEARVGLVCGYKNAPLILENELVEGWNLPKGMIKVFNRDDIPNLSENLKKWIDQ